jgi:hypothetical protein
MMDKDKSKYGDSVLDFAQDTNDNLLEKTRS